jgi:hypothetical protein
LKKEKKENVEPINIISPGRSHVYSGYVEARFEEKKDDVLYFVNIFTDSILFLLTTDNYEELGYKYVNLINLKSNSVPWIKELLMDKRTFQLHCVEFSILFRAQEM